MLPPDLNALLICVVVLSMALTPVLAEVGDRFEAAEKQAQLDAQVESLQYELMDPADPHSMEEQQRAHPHTLNEIAPVVILGFNEASQARPRHLPPAPAASRLRCSMCAKKALKFWGPCVSGADPQCAVLLHR